MISVGFLSVRRFIGLAGLVLVVKVSVGFRADGVGFRDVLVPGWSGSGLIWFS